MVVGSSASAQSFRAEGIPADIAARAMQSRTGIYIETCSSLPVSGSMRVTTAADAAEFFASNGLPVQIVGNGLKVGCDQLDNDMQFVEAFTGTGVEAPHSTERPAPLPARGQTYPPSPSPFREPDIYEISDGRWISRELVDQVQGIFGIKIARDETPNVPLLLAGPANAVNEARRYLERVNVCPVQLEFEATVIQRADNRIKDRDIGLRLGTDTIGIGTAGTSTGTGIAFSWLSAFFESSDEAARFRVNSTLSAVLMPGEPVSLRDGSQIPVRGATSVTDRETRVDVVYRDAGHTLDIELLALDGRDALIAVVQEFSSVGTVTDLGPTFATRSITSTLRVPVGEAVALAVVGADAVSTSRRRGIFSRRDFQNSRQDGAFMVFHLREAGCRERELASATASTAAGDVHD